MSSLIRFVASIRFVKTYQHQLIRRFNSASASESIQTETMNSNNREKGVVKRFSKDKGYGFISKQSDGTDCFVHFKNINATGFKTLEQGQEVEFTIVQGEKGLEARDVNILSIGKGHQSFLDNSSKSNFSRRPNVSSAFNFGGTKYHSENDGSMLREKTFDFNDGLRDSSEENTVHSSKQSQIGFVKRWSDERGFGFIRRMNGGPDIFCHVRSLKDGVQALEEGQTVQYRLHRTEKGEEARDVSILKDDNSSSQSIDSNERHTGTVKRWIDERSYGFIQSNQGGFDVFVHRRNLPDGITSLIEGQTVEFSIKSGEKGPTADDVIIENQS